MFLAIFSAQFILWNGYIKGFLSFGFAFVRNDILPLCCRLVGGKHSIILN